MVNPLDARLKWAIIFGFCYLMSVVIMATTLRAIGTLVPANTVEYYFNFFLFALGLLPFFATLILTIRGYIYLSEKYGKAALKVGAWIFSVSAGMLYVLILLDSFEMGTRADTRFADTLIGLVMTFYVIGLIVMGIGSYWLKSRLGNVVFGTTGLGLLILLEILVVTPLFIAGNDAPAFATWYVWYPVYESLFVIASMALFYRAMRD
ncbi:hypothetical protein HYW59_05060 [Candidatus Kaiserbacteria bacterium]|nr:hypothetical protein [Candidatus Kaiserbacteria bacterium]